MPNLRFKSYDLGMALINYIWEILEPAGVFLFFGSAAVCHEEVYMLKYGFVFWGSSIEPESSH
jgi:hypothetical protein